MKRLSEYVSLGHPDKMADYISQYLLDRYIEQDPDTRYAVEVQVKDNYATLGGEVASKVRFTDEEIAGFVRAAVEEIGYTKEYQQAWGRENTVCGADMQVTAHIGQQSPDIARGLDGWGDQGIFFGYADPDYDYFMPQEHRLAAYICHELFYSGFGGLDIKTQVVTDGPVMQVVVAIPVLRNEAVNGVMSLVERYAYKDAEIIINGTGCYKRHGTLADCGTTGRKLAVDFYGGACRIGGGSPWTKDATKADLTLNLYARWLALKYAKKYGCAVTASLSCCIGRREVTYQITNEKGRTLEANTRCIAPAELKERFRLDKPIFASMCRWGLFGEYQQDKEWEKY